MIENVFPGGSAIASSGGALRRARLLMSGALAFWAVSLAAAHLPGILRWVFYPNYAEAPRLGVVGTQALGAPAVWTALVAWCVSWAFVAGWVTSAWAMRGDRPAWAPAALLLVSPASALAFRFAASGLLRVATDGAWEADGVISFPVAVLVQLVTSWSYTVLARRLPRVDLEHARRDSGERVARPG